MLVIAFFFFSIPYGHSQAFGFEFIENKKRLVIPFELYNNLIVVPVTINETMPLKFILDTGIRTAILTEKIISDLLDISYDRKISLKGPGDGGLVEAYVANSVRIELPGVVGRGQSLLVLQEDYLQLSRHLGTEVHGILGYELFSRFVVEINYRASYLVLHKKEFFEPKRSYMELPLVLEDTKPYMFANIFFKNGYMIHGKFLIDTGASHALLLERKDNNGVPVPQRYLRANLGRGLGGLIRGKIARVASLSFLDYKFTDVIASFPDPQSYLDSLIVDRDGTVGGELLKRFRVVLDYSTETAYLKKINRVYKQNFQYNMSGMEVVAEEEDDYHRFLIEEVRNNSPADQIGIKSGDVILVLNGHSSSNMTLGFINSLLNSKEGKKIRVVVQRGEEKIRKVFRLKSLI